MPNPPLRSWYSFWPSGIENTRMTVPCSQNRSKDAKKETGLWQPSVQGDGLPVSLRVILMTNERALPTFPLAVASIVPVKLKDNAETGDLCAWMILAACGMVIVAHCEY
jgi:hypothetical protein